MAGPGLSNRTIMMATSANGKERGSVSRIKAQSNTIFKRSYSIDGNSDPMSFSAIRLMRTRPVMDSYTERASCTGIRLSAQRVKKRSHSGATQAKSATTASYRTPSRLGRLSPRASIPGKGSRSAACPPGTIASFGRWNFSVAMYSIWNQIMARIQLIPSR